MAMALSSSRQQSRPTITRSAFASEPPAPMACCFSPPARLTTCYWSSMLVACRWVHLWLQHMIMCSGLHEHTHAYTYSMYYHTIHTDLRAWPNAHIWKDMSHNVHLKLFLHLSWQCQSLNTVTQADKPVWCEQSVNSIPVSCHIRN